MTEKERREALAKIAADLARLTEQAARLDAPMLAFLIVKAMDEAKYQASRLATG